MKQNERRHYLLSALLSEQAGDKPAAMSEQAGDKPMGIPKDMQEQKRMLRALLNVRMPKEASDEFLKVQDDYLKEAIAEKGIVKLADLTPIQKGIYLWQGDITTLAVDAIVNAANSQMLGCFYPCHGCIDNAIHTYAGIQLRNECYRKMEEKRRMYGRDYEEPMGGAMVTKGYNLPCRYVIHTVGPIVSPIASARLRKEDCEQLARCYRSCLEAALEHEIKSIAFCCISTGEFHFPNEKAARIAVETVGAFLKSRGNWMEVVFNVFKDIDYEIYRSSLGRTVQN